MCALFFKKSVDNFEIAQNKLILSYGCRTPLSLDFDSLHSPYILLDNQFVILFILKYRSQSVSPDKDTNDT